MPVWYERAQSYIAQHYGQYLQHIAGPQKPGEPAAAEQLRQHLAPWLVSQAQGLLKSGASLFNSVALLFLTPVITFFLLRDWDKMIASVRDFLPRQQAPAIIEVVREIDTTISAYLRGTLIVLLIVSAFYMVSLGLIGLHYGLLIGLVAGMFSFVPYLGSTGGFLVSGGVALAQFWPDYTMVGAVCGVFVFGQVIEGNVLTPYIVGNKVGLHPVWLLFALVASGYVLGFLGLIISVPLAAAIGVLVRYAVRRYYESALHNEGGDGRRARQRHGGAGIILRAIESASLPQSPPSSCPSPRREKGRLLDGCGGNLLSPWGEGWGEGALRNSHANSNGSCMKGARARFRPAAYSELGRGRLL